VYSCTLSLPSALVGGEWLTPRLVAVLQERDPVPFVEEAGGASGAVWKGAENLATTEIFFFVLSVYYIRTWFFGFDLGTDRPLASCYTDYAIPAHI
jgi:hypothetical protein